MAVHIQDKNTASTLRLQSSLGPCHPAGWLCCDSSALKEKYPLTHDLDDLSQEDTIGHILLEILDETFVARFGQIMIGPVRVDL